MTSIAICLLATVVSRGHVACQKSEAREGWVHEEVLDAMQKRFDRLPDAMGLRRQTDEHVVGTLKAWMSSPPFLTRPTRTSEPRLALASSPTT